MTTTQGVLTGRIGQMLEQRFAQDAELAALRVFYDHGPRSKSEGVAQPTTYMGRRYGADATLSGLDIAVVLG
ncbi:hypothetical protein JXD38_11855, partial [candidate division WOR-3 bacterium]|nr:hypothetical protein [candidate division WOR-3 bacterium]